MKNRGLTIVTLVSTFLFLPGLTHAADVYLSTAGIKTSGKSVAGDWSNANSYGNLQAAMAAMSSGDTLTIADGTYTGINNSIDQFNHPPSGTSKTNMTVVRAKNIPCQNGVPCNQPLKVYFQATLVDATHSTGATFSDDRGDQANPGIIQYIKFWGIKWNEVGIGQWWDHIYFKQDAFMGILDGNNSAFTAEGRYNLVEDSVAYGKGRYKILFYDLSRDIQRRGPGYNLCRRCIARNDWAIRNDVTQDPIATFVSYYNRKTAFINTIDVDSNTPTFWRDGGSDEINGAFSQPVDDSTSAAHNMRILGSIVINSAAGGIWGADSNGHISGNEVVDTAIIKSAGGVVLRGGGTINRMTMSDIGLNNFTYRSANQRNAIESADNGFDTWSGESLLVTNSVAHDIFGSVFSSNATGNYINTNSIGTLGTTPTHQITTNPIYNASTNPTGSIKYPIRVENGSSLVTAGSVGGQIGANIQYALGQDGQFQDDAGWDQPTGVSLWPWPSEDWVKAELSSMPATINGNTMPSPTRGFTTPAAKRLDEVNPVTLTSYIWESLGNPIPSSIYGASSDVTPPSAPTGLSAQ